MNICIFILKYIGLMSIPVMISNLILSTSLLCQVSQPLDWSCCVVCYRLKSLPMDTSTTQAKSSLETPHHQLSLPVLKHKRNSFTSSPQRLQHTRRCLSRTRRVTPSAPPPGAALRGHPPCPTQTARAPHHSSQPSHTLHRDPPPPPTVTTWLISSPRCGRP